MVANSKSHVISQTAYAGAYGNFYAVWEMACFMKGLNYSHCMKINEVNHSYCSLSQEGKQASLAADFSLNQFRFLGRLLMVHGRYSYKRSAGLCHFVMHRGLIISTMQAIFSAIFFFASVALYQGVLAVG